MAMVGEVMGERLLIRSAVVAVAHGALGGFENFNLTLSAHGFV